MYWHRATKSPVADNSSTVDYSWATTTAWKGARFRPRSLLQFGKRTSKAGTVTVLGAQVSEIGGTSDIVAVYNTNAEMTDQEGHVQVEAQKLPQNKDSKSAKFRCSRLHEETKTQTF